MKSITVSKSFINGRNRLLKYTEDSLEELYLAYSRFDDEADDGIHCIDSEEPVTTPVMIDKDGELMQIVRGCYIHPIEMDIAGPEDLTTIHPKSPEEFVSIMRICDGLFDSQSICIVKGYENDNAAITAKALYRKAKDNSLVTFFLVYEDDIQAYKVYSSRRINF